MWSYGKCDNCLCKGNDSKKAITPVVPGEGTMTCRRCLLEHVVEKEEE